MEKPALPAALRHTGVKHNIQLGQLHQKQQVSLISLGWLLHPCSALLSGAAVMLSRSMGPPKGHITSIWIWIGMGQLAHQLQNSHKPLNLCTWMDSYKTCSHR